ncbi:hypothetical protein Tco_0449244 [Tanacetum coccineum]
MNQNFNYSNSFGLDQIKPPKFSTVQLLEIERINKEEKDMSIEEIMSEMRLIDDEINDIANDLSYKRFRGENIDDEYERDLSLLASQCIKSICNDEDDSIPLRDIIARYSPSVAITSSPPDLPTKEPEDSLIMGDEHLDTIPKKESDELIKSSVENLVLIPKIISSKIDPHYFNAESNLIESLLNRDILIDSSPKFDFLLEEFSGELAHIDLIPPGIEKADFELKEEIRLVENLLYDNSSPRPPEELNLEIADTILESLSPSPILVEDSDSHMLEIDLFLATNDSMPPGIEDDDYDSEGDIRFLEELL